MKAADAICPAEGKPLRISIITPNYNGGRYLEETIRSVVSQDYPNLEYIFVDGGSTDDSMSIVNRYARHFSHIICEKDDGHADALNKGFRRATGDVLAWINSDDLLLPGSLQRVSQVFATLPSVQWLTGQPSTADEKGTVSPPRPVKAWSWIRFVCGDFRHIQQESTFWRRGLWQDAGGRLDTRYQLANDFELWLRFFRRVPLYSLNAPLGCFRFRTGQRSAAFAADYEAECEAAFEQFIDSLPVGLFSRHFDLYPSQHLLSRRTRPASLPEALKATDPPIISIDSGLDVPLMAKHESADVPLTYQPDHRGREDMVFDGVEQVIWTDGPDFLDVDLTAVEVELAPFSPGALVPAGMSDNGPPMPLVLGPVTLYEFGSGRYSLRIRFQGGAVSHELELTERDRLYRIKVCVSTERYAVFLDGRGVAVEPTRGAQQAHARYAVLGGGFENRFWVGTVKRVAATVQPRQPKNPAEARPVTFELEHQDGVRRLARRHRAPVVLHPALKTEPGARATPLSAFRNRHRGKRCFVMGNGPSLNKMDLEKLAGEVVFACNASFLLFDRVSWRPTYYACVDTRVVRDRAKEITQMLDEHPSITAFFPATVHLHDGSGTVYEGRNIIPPGQNRYYFNEVGNRETNHPETMFSLDADDYVVQPYTVAITMLQLAAFMGFEDIYLIGCDTSYQVQQSVKQEGRQIEGVGLLLTSTKDDDSNHFDPRYFGEGRQWHNPQVSKMLDHYRWAQRALRGSGTRVFNATVGGQLEVFPRVDFNTLFPRSAAPSRTPARTRPLLSIAIPAYDRPGPLLHALERFAEQIAGRFEDEVEIVVSDDCSPNDSLRPVSELAKAHRFLRYRRYEKNIGLEKNLVACTEDCHGEYLWVFGDDDYLETGDALERILQVLREDRYDAVVLNRTRRNTDLSQLLSPNWMGLNPEAREYFSGMRDFCMKFGFISVLGFISINIFRRRLYQRVDAKKYAGTMYPQLGALVEAFSDRPTMLMGAPLVCHRTQTAEEKRRVLGEKSTEADFMADTRRRNAIYFSHPYIAMIDELVGRGAFSHQDITRIPENTVINGLLVDFLLDCVRLSDEVRTGATDEAWARTSGFLSRLALDEKQRAKVAPVLARHGHPLSEPGTASMDKRTRLSISVVTPSFNQAEFLPDCLKSVRDQSYPALEHLVFDPGSKDSSREIAASFGHVSLFSEPDSGQSDALNKGFRRVRGDIIAWLNSDDMLADKHVFERVVRRFAETDAPDIVYGKGIYVDEAGAKLRDAYINRDPSSLNWRFHQEDGIMQPALFMRRSVVEKVGPLRDDLHFSMDYEYWIRCIKAGIRFVFIDSDLAVARYHLNNKTYGQRGSSYSEVCRMMKEHFGYVNHMWLKRFAEFLAEGHDGVLAHAANAGIQDKDKLQRIYRDLLVEHNGDAKTQQTLHARRDERGYRETLDEMVSLGLADPGTAPLCGPFTRDAHRHLDETACVAKLFSTGPRGSVMVDVGAHHGLALAPFLDMDWQVFAFEPDEQNRAKLLERLGKHRRGSTVKVDSRAVTKESRAKLPFFRSDVSTGISGLSAFHESHREAQLVDSVSLTDFSAHHQISQVDFLKIDTEGHDLFVLQGFPWDRMRPKVVECEFEDSKTVPLGYTFHDLARFLVDLGYTVYVSEWHPIVRYGTRHDWCRLTRYPCELGNASGWGNLVAFRDAVDESHLVQVFAESANPQPASPAPSKSGQNRAAVAQAGRLPELHNGASFTNLGPGRWRFTGGSSAAGRMWAASFPVSHASEYLGGATLTSDAPVKVRITLGRHGATPWEGRSMDVSLTPGRAQAVYLRERFQARHEALKVQLEVLDAPTGKDVVLEMRNALVVETVSGITSRIAPATVRLQSANELLRQGDCVSSIGMFLMLRRKLSLRMYEDNALFAARRLGVDVKQSPVDLFELME